MTDIVERLKEASACARADNCPATADEYDKGIAEIERLRAALNKIMRNDPEGYDASIARAALEGKDE